VTSTDRAAVTPLLADALRLSLARGGSVHGFTRYALRRFGRRVIPHLEHLYAQVAAGEVSVPRVSVSPPSPAPIDPQRRQEMIANTAYLKAERAGFSGDPQRYWDEAEAEVDRQLRHEHAPGAPSVGSD